jgi:integrase
VKHHDALAIDELPAFFAQLREREGVSARALEFAILTSARTSEVTEMTWDEIDFDAKAWTVPAERMKAKKPHRVPLSEAALSILTAPPRSGPYVFPGASAAKPNGTNVFHQKKSPRTGALN